MPTSGRKPDLLVDTSVAVALSVGDHEFHGATVKALRGRVLGLDVELVPAGRQRSPG
jgi:hypothetical protein